MKSCPWAAGGQRARLLLGPKMPQEDQEAIKSLACLQPTSGRNPHIGLETKHSGPILGKACALTSTFGDTPVCSPPQALTRRGCSAS